MPNNNWMEGLDDERRLSSICMPGSHDACMYTVKYNDVRWRVDAAITQFHTIRQQLDAGCRYFDVRVYKDGDTLRTGHFQKKEKAVEGRGAFGPKFFDVCEDVTDFLEDNDQEVVILKISLADNAVDDALRMIRLRMGDWLYSAAAVRGIAGVKLGTLRGMIVASFDKEMLKDSGSGFRYKLQVAKKKTPARVRMVRAVEAETRSVLYLNGDAPTADTLASVLKKQNDSRKSAIKKELGHHLEMFYMTITAGISTAIGAGGFGMAGSKTKMSIADNTAREIGLVGVDANPLNAKKCKYSSWEDGAAAAYQAVINQVTRMNTLPVNIFMYDFVNSEVNDIIIARNFPEED